MMGFHYLWLSNDPALAAHLRKANEERGAVVYALFRSLVDNASSAVRGAMATYRRARQMQRTRRALSELDDRALRDIGLKRDEIVVVARLGATTNPEVGLTLAELRRGEALGGYAQVVPLVRNSWVQDGTPTTETLRRRNAA